MTIQVNLPEDVVQKSKRSDEEEVALINAVADELNAEAEDTLEYQTLSRRLSFSAS